MMMRPRLRPNQPLAAWRRRSSSFSDRKPSCRTERQPDASRSKCSVTCPAPQSSRELREEDYTGTLVWNGTTN